MSYTNKQRNDEICKLYERIEKLECVYKNYKTVLFEKIYLNIENVKLNEENNILYEENKLLMEKIAIYEDINYDENENENENENDENIPKKRKLN